MGWTFGAGMTRREALEESTAGWTTEHSVTTRLARAVRGNTVWSVNETTYADPAKVTDRWIGCTLLARSSNSWGYKQMDETSGPNEVSCPLSFLDMVPDPKTTYSTGWRDRVRAYHARVNRKLSIGDSVKLTNGWIADVVSVRPLRGCVNGVLYRIPRKMLEG
jgi:hypothetical protein